MFDSIRGPASPAPGDGGPAFRQSFKPWQEYAFAFAVMFAAVGLRLALDGALGGHPTLVIFIIPIVLCALVGGVRAGLLATALAVSASYFLLAPSHGFEVQDTAARWQLFFVLLSGASISGVNEALMRARRRVHVANHARQVAEASLMPLTRSIADMMEGIQIIDGQWRYVFANPAAARHARRTQDELVGHTVVECYPGIEATPLFQAMTAVMTDRNTREVTGAFKFPNGSTGWYEMLIEPHQDGLLIRSVDITERRQAVDARRASEARYHALFEHAPDGIVIAGLDGHYLDANASMCRMIGYTREEMIGMQPSDIVTRAETRHFDAALTAITTGTSYQREWQFRRKDGTVFAADVIATTMPDGNLMAMIHDVTERKRAEEEVLKAGALKSAIFNSANFSSIATDAKGVIQIFNVGAERMLGYAAADVMNRITPADISDPAELVARASALSTELDTPIAPGFDALVFKASHGTRTSTSSPTSGKTAAAFRRWCRSPRCVIRRTGSSATC